MALSGGVFQNLLLLGGRARAGCAAAGLRVLVHSRLPCNDGGISLGQVAVAAAALGLTASRPRDVIGSRGYSVGTS